MPLYGKGGKLVSFREGQTAIAKKYGGDMQRAGRIMGAVEREARKRGGNIGAAIQALRAMKNKRG